MVLLSETENLDRFVCFGPWEVWVGQQKLSTYAHHEGQSISLLKGYIWISSNEVDETGAYYTEWSKAERKTPIQYTNAYIWNLERW